MQSSCKAIKSVGKFYENHLLGVRRDLASSSTLAGTTVYVAPWRLNVFRAAVEGFRRGGK